MVHTAFLNLLLRCSPPVFCITLVTGQLLTYLSQLPLSPLQACPTSPRWCGRARSCPPGSATSSRHSWWVTGSSSCSTGPSCPSVWTTTRAMSTREFPCWAPYTTYHTRGFSSRNKIVWYKSDDYYKDSSAQTQQNLQQR